MELVRAIVRSVVQPWVSAEKVRPRLVEGENRSLLIVFNDGIEDQPAEIKVPSRYRRATDLYSNQTQTVREVTIQIVVPFESASVLRLE